MSTPTPAGNAGKTTPARTTTGKARAVAQKTAKPGAQAMDKPARPAGKVSASKPAAAPAATPTAAKPAASKPVASKAAASRPVKAESAKAERKKVKADKPKVVRDSFTIPKAEYAQLAELKKRGVTLGLEVKKSELLRAGLLLLSACSDAAFRKAMAQVPTLKTGRPGKD